MSRIPEGMLRRLEIAKNIKAASGGWPESFVNLGVEAMRKWPEKHWKELHEQFDTMADAMTAAVLLKVCEEVVEEASENPEPYKHVIELFMRFIKGNVNARLGRDHNSELWVCMESQRQFQQYESDPTVDEARQLVQLADDLTEELKRLDITEEVKKLDLSAIPHLDPDQEVALGSTISISFG